VACALILIQALTGGRLRPSRRLPFNLIIRLPPEFDVASRANSADSANSPSARPSGTIGTAPEIEIEERIAMALKGGVPPSMHAPSLRCR
jgi:hypothetical protein